MPTVRVNDIMMYYEIHGQGEPVVLIAGLNSDHTLYQKLGIIPRLAESYQVVAFDNRGVGQTDKPDIPYSIEMMAEDTAGLLSVLGITQAHLLGTSMGGRIAVALALQHPSRVRSLILVSTIMKSLKGTPMTWSRFRVNLMLKIPMIRGPHPYYAVARQLEASRPTTVWTGSTRSMYQPSSCMGRRTRVLPITWLKQCRVQSRTRKCSPFLAAIYFSF